MERVARGLDPLGMPDCSVGPRPNSSTGGTGTSSGSELAEEGACGGFFAGNRPPTETFQSPHTHGTLGGLAAGQVAATWWSGKSPADQRACHLPQGGRSATRRSKAVLDRIEEENRRAPEEGPALGRWRPEGHHGRTGRRPGRASGPPRSSSCTKLQQEGLRTSSRRSPKARPRPRSAERDQGKKGGQGAGR